MFTLTLFACVNLNFYGMKRFIYSALFVFSVMLANGQFQSFGKSVDPEGSVSVETLVRVVSEQPLSVKVKGIVLEVCQMKGCWMTLATDNGQNVRVTFKNYGFFVPKDISGKEVVLEGVAEVEMLSEADAKHYADDAGVPYHPSMRNQVSVVADGVLVAE